MSYDNGDNFTNVSKDVASISSLFNDAYQFPTLTDNTRIEEGKFEKTSLKCDPYFDMLAARDRLNRMADVVDALHNVTNSGEFPGGRPRELQQALRGLQGAGQANLNMLQTMLRESMNTQERGVTLNLTSDRGGNVHLTMSRTAGGVTYNIELTGSTCIASSTDKHGKTTSISPRQAFDSLLPLTPPHRQNEH